MWGMACIPMSVRMHHACLIFGALPKSLSCQLLQRDSAGSSNVLSSSSYALLVIVAVFSGLGST